MGQWTNYDDGDIKASYENGYEQALRDILDFVYDETSHLPYELIQETIIRHIELDKLEPYNIKGNTCNES